LSYTAQASHHVLPIIARVWCAAQGWRRVRRPQGRYRAASAGGLRPAL